MKKKVLAFLLVAVMLAASVVPALGVSKSDWQGMKDIADQIEDIMLGGSDMGRLVAKALAEKYGYQVVNEFSFSTANGTGWMGIACDHLVTKEQIITVLKELFPLLSDELAEAMVDGGIGSGAWWCQPAADGKYAVGVGGGYNPYYYAGYTQEGDTFRFYYGCPGYGEGPNVASIEYNGKTYYAWPDYYVTADGEYADSIEYQGKTYVNIYEEGWMAEIPLPEMGTEEFEALFNQVDSLDGYHGGGYNYQFGTASSVTVEGTTYYHRDNGFFALNLPETETEWETLLVGATLLTAPYVQILDGDKHDLDRYKYHDGGYYSYHVNEATHSGEEDQEVIDGEALSVPVICAGIPNGNYEDADHFDTYVYYNGSYYALPDDVWGEQLTSITADLHDGYYGDGTYYYSASRNWFYRLSRLLDEADQLTLSTVESGGKLYTKAYGSMFGEAEDGTDLYGAMYEAGAEEYSFVYNGVTYYECMGHFQSMPDFGLEIVLKLKDGKVSLVSYSDPYGEEVSFPKGMLYQPADDGVTYAVKAGTPTVWTKDSGKDLVITSEADFSKFVAVKVDGKIVDKANYTVESGSTKVTFKESYLKTLSDGEHIFTIVSTDGEASTKLTVQATAAAPSQAAQDGAKTVGSATVVSPKDGDTSLIALWLTLAVLSLAGAAVMIIADRKKHRA